VAEKKKFEVQIGIGPSPFPKEKAEEIGVSMSKHSVTMLPPPAGCCQECGVEHDPPAPHNRDSIFYQMNFRRQHGRWPTWADAIAHCDDRIKADLKDLLEKEGVWSEPVDGLSEEEKAARAVGGLPTHSTKPDGGKYFAEVIEIENGDEAWDEEETVDEYGPQDGAGESGAAGE